MDPRYNEDFIIHFNATQFFSDNNYNVDTLDWYKEVNLYFNTPALVN